MSLEALCGKHGPLRDGRGRYRRRTWEELGVLGRANVVLARATLQEAARLARLLTGQQWVRISPEGPVTPLVRVPSLLDQ